MRVSVIIPVYNAGKFVESAVDSALAQPEVGEVILVEDGSPGDDLEICMRLAGRDSRVTVLRHPGGANRGAGESRNLGLERASCDLIAFLDADDVFLPGRFAADVEFLRLNAGVDGRYNAIGERRYSGSPRDWVDDLSAITSLHHEVGPENLVYEMGPLGSSGHFSIIGLTLRKSALGGLAPFGAYAISQDTEWLIRLAYERRLTGGSLTVPVALRGVHGGNRSRDRDEWSKWQLPVYESLFRWARVERVPLRLTFLIWESYFRFFCASPDVSVGSKRYLVARSAVLCPRMLGIAEFRRYLPGWRHLAATIKGEASRP